MNGPIKNVVCRSVDERRSRWRWTAFWFTRSCRRPPFRTLKKSSESREKPAREKSRRKSPRLRRKIASLPEWCSAHDEVRFKISFFSTSIIIDWISNACINKNESYFFNWESDNINNRQFDNLHLTNIFQKSMIIIWGLKKEWYSFRKTGFQSRPLA